MTPDDADDKRRLEAVIARVRQVVSAKKGLPVSTGRAVRIVLERYAKEIE